MCIESAEVATDDFEPVRIRQQQRDQILAMALERFALHAAAFRQVGDRELSGPLQPVEHVAVLACIRQGATARVERPLLLGAILGDIGEFDFE